jgi:hypothetical protein
VTDTKRTPGLQPAVDALVAAAQSLPSEGAEAVAVAITEALYLAAQRSRHQITPRVAKRVRFIGAIRSVAESVGHVPTTTEYTHERNRRRKFGDESLPAISVLLKFFGSWHRALSSAALAERQVGSLNARAAYRPLKMPRYSNERIVQCLRACASDLGRIPTVRDFLVWRDGRTGRSSGGRVFGVDIPHFRTIYERFGNWPSACKAAGITQDIAERWAYSRLEPSPDRVILFIRGDGKRENARLQIRSPAVSAGQWPATEHTVTVFRTRWFVRSGMHSRPATSAKRCWSATSPRTRQPPGPPPSRQARATHRSSP